VDELWLLLAQLVAKVLLAVLVVNSGVVGSLPSFVDALAAPPGGLKSSFVEAQAPVEFCSNLGRCLPIGGSAYLMEALKILAMEFLAKVRAEVDWVIFFGLGLKINASRDIRKRMVWVFSGFSLGWA
jgi:hypothetical protein